MEQTPKYGLKKPGGSDYGDVAVLNEDMDKIDAALARKAETDETGRLKQEQVPNIDCGGFDLSVEVHNDTPYAHAVMRVDGNAVEPEDTSQTLAEHMENIMAHQNIEIDGNGN